MNKRIIKSKPTGLIAILLLGMLMAAGCSGPRYGTIIDWIDFVNIDGTVYEGVSNGVLRDSGSVTDEVVGTVSKKLDGNVTDSSYRNRSGDAAFLEKGTKLYRVDGFEPEDLVAVHDEEQIGGYKLYAREHYDGLPDEDFDAVLQAKPSSVSIYRWRETEPIRILTGSESETFIRYLKEASHTPNDRSQSSQDPISYQLVFDTEEPVLYTFRIEDDGEQVRFREEYRVDHRIRELLKP
ncbi:hypothetical protein CDO73_09325 [Saccharibacillus sp. O23]|uniref:hypothetical protein n=1 Tax=Saccharibacillus sp. O23 TaxID=2009338 RepID=UPI000B4DF1BA|nr:hypothetical protein [Saccharibacillus sp. O23]OWR30782.1 hypothetical protein CDO73_09325 [Saccharibacillus sp. O23]